MEDILKYNHEKDIFSFFSLFVLSVISVYYFPPILNKVFFLLLLVSTWFSKKNYFWLTFFIIIISGPMRLFENYSGQALHRIPEYDIVGKYGTTFNELFLILFFIKAKVKGIRNILLLNNNYLILLYLIVFLYCLSFVYGFTDATLISYSRALLYFTLSYSVPRLIKNEDLIFMFKIFILFTLLTFSNQILTATIGFNLADKIAGKHWFEFFFMDAEFKRAYDSVLPQFFTFIFGLVMYSLRKPLIKKKYLLFIIIISYLSIFMTGTRGWILAFSIVVIYYILFIEKQMMKSLMRVIISVMLIISIASFIPKLNNLLRSNVDRVSTLKSMARGDITAGGTSIRLTSRLHRLAEGIKQNPILGWGFSNTFKHYRDGHVGWANQILQMGIVGLLLFIMFWFSFWNYNANLSKRLSLKNPFKKSIAALNIGLLCLLVIHSTSRTMFNISMHHTMLTLVIMFFIFSDMWAKIGIEEEKRNKKNIC